MKPLPLRLAAVLLSALAPSVAARAADQPVPKDIPTPDWVKMVDQGDRDRRFKGYQTPEGVNVEIVAENPVVDNPMAMAFADDGTLFVLERRPGVVSNVTSDKDGTFIYKDGSKRRGNWFTKDVPDLVKRLSDAKGKGVYDEATTVLEDDFPWGILPYEGWLYVAGHGSVRRYKQSKGEGPYDIKEVVAQGFGGHHNVSGMTIGPDGWLYLTAGDGDNVVEGSDGSRATVLRSGAVFRCRPDGSKMQTYAVGFVNPDRPLSFDAAGNIFHVDENAWGKDGGFAASRLLNIAEGADFGWRLLPGEDVSLPDPLRAAAEGERPGTLPPMLRGRPGRFGGLLIYNDTRFPENYRGLLLHVDEGRNAVHAYKVECKGATFEVVAKFDFLQCDCAPFRQAVLGPDGAIYVIEGRDEEHGRILRLTWAGTKDQPALPTRGMDSWSKIAALGDDDLVKALLNDDASDREHARRELARRGEKERQALLKLLKDADQPDAGRIAALGALESMWNDDVQAAVLSVLGRDSNPDVRRLAADALGLNAAQGDSDVHSALLRTLLDTAPEVRRSAALAMSHVAADGAPDALVNTWASDDGRDAYLSDGLVRAVENLGKPGVERLIALGESGVKKDMDKVVTAFTMMRTRPAADAIPRVLGNPHLSAAQRAALLRSYENYLLDPPVSLTPVVDYLTAHPDEDAAVKKAGVEALAASLVGPKDARRVGQAYLDKMLPPETRPQVVDVLRQHADSDAECARLLAAVMKE